jgi:thymidylate synthase (FAD)
MDKTKGRRMKVNLVSYSKSDGSYLIDSANATELVAFCARVSNPDNQMNQETSDKLIKYLMKHKHWSPLEMVSVCLEIETTRDIARQILRHRSFSFQEFSQRYANPQDMEEAFTYREPRLQDTKNRQNSIEVYDQQLEMDWGHMQKEVIKMSKEAYDWAISKGIAKEQARVVLPEGLTKTKLYMNGTLRSWVHYIELRGANGTQKEHMEIAHECAKVIAKIFPLMKELDV